MPRKNISKKQKSPRLYGWALFWDMDIGLRKTGKNLHYLRNQSSASSAMAKKDTWGVQRIPLSLKENKYNAPAVKLGSGNVDCGVSILLVWNGLPTERRRTNGPKDTLENTLLQFTKNKMGVDWIFQHENSPRHILQLVKGWLESQNFRVLKWPAQWSNPFTRFEPNQAPQGKARKTNWPRISRTQAKRRCVTTCFVNGTLAIYLINLYLDSVPRWRAAVIKYKIQNAIYNIASKSTIAFNEKWTLSKY